jgi:3-phenylpropionate/trans-cinnamate dioxygenase ferredoxin subunit
VHARTYAVEVEPGETLAKGPFAAETVPISVEQNYVVITV